MIPSASDDPFGNMNAVAQMGQMTRGPDIVIVNDGKPVESVSTGSKVGTIAKYVGIALVPLVLGVAVGSIAKDAKFYNEGIDDAKGILENVKKVKKDLVVLTGQIDEALKKDVLGDPELTKIIETALAGQTLRSESGDAKQPEKTPDNSVAIFKARQHSLNAALAARILTFYSHVGQLATMLDDHVKASRADDLSLGKAIKASAEIQVTIGGSAFPKYAIVLANPTADDLSKGASNAVGAQVVEIGPPFCQDGSMGQGGECATGIAALGYRTVPSGNDNDAKQWSKAELAQPAAGQPFGLKQLVILAHTGVGDALLKGAEPTASEILYRRRLAAIKALLTSLVEEANQVESQLAPKANESSHFTFFL
ncbi:MAG: hypothetical protein K8W52_11445 [Deltaproteobacteria bacterium]|nr:hypothetical protein [Deltaproteobacteria bacterium]